MDEATRRFVVEPQRLRRRLDPATLPFASTAEVAPLEGTIGQPRALDALQFGLEIHTPGYNLFVTGAPGSGRLTTVRDHLERVARERPVPGDWVYVHDFDQPDRPRAIGLPAGKGRELARHVQELVAAARTEITAAFESEDYQRRRSALVEEVEKREDALRQSVQSFATERGFSLQFSPTGISLLPLLRGRPMTPEDMAAVPADQRAELERRSAEIHEELQADARRLRQVEREGTQHFNELDRSVGTAVITQLLGPLRDEYAGNARVLDYFDDIAKDVPEHLDDFRPGGEQPQGLAGLRAALASRDDHLALYRVNVFVDNSGLTSAPVVIEHSPRYYNLLGRVEYRPQMGVMLTDFTQVRPGSLHRANGGFLVVDAMELISQPFAYEALKRALRSGEVAIENLAEQLSFVPTASLRPEPIPLDVKVVLIGSPLLHLLLYMRDDDLRELFKVKVDFAPEMEWDEPHVRSYAAFISRWVLQSGLLHFDRSAVARVVEEGARLRENQRKLSTRLLEISDLVTEASFWAQKAGHTLVEAADVDEAVRRKEYRSSLVEERMRELIAERTIMIATEGARVAQLNGLTVAELGDHSFGQPVRITATVALGRGSVESIEREIELSGPIHSKGVLILSGYLAETYAQDLPLAVRATLTFEQSYDEVEGDSASSAELYTLLSALATLPLAQGIAVTGSINQKGEVQAVGGVTRKVEGFFAVCKARGLTGEQGVVIPAANVPHLMLSDEVVEAVRGGQFHVWAVSSVDEALELLTGRPAGVRGEDGYPEGTVHRLVEDRLRAYAERLRGFAAPSTNGHHPAAAVTPPVAVGQQQSNG